MMSTTMSLKPHRVAVVLALLAALASRALAKDDEWRLLFDGRSLAGWVERGGAAKYRAENGEIVGTSVPKTGNSFLCTDRDFGDFILELEFKVDPRLNSGVQFRSECFDEPKEIQHDGKAIKISAGRVHGYQAEIDPSDRAWTCGIYDEGRRGWLNDLKNNQAAHEAFRQNDWNKMRIECRGDSLKTWLNDVPAADLTDVMTRKGFIALQVHGVGDKTEPMEIRWRNIRIREIGSP
jgi:hypothetical protein